MLTGLRGQNWSSQDHGVSIISATWLDRDNAQSTNHTHREAVLMAAASGKTSTTAPSGSTEDDFDKLLNTVGQDDTASDGDDFDDLLDDVEEDDSEGWVPTEKGEGISGKVVKIGEVRSDFAKPGEDPMVPSVTIEIKDGTKYRVIGYGSVLKREIQDANPQVGDRMAVKYFGEKPVRKGPYAGKPYKHFGIAIRRSGE